MAFPGGLPPSDWSPEKRYHSLTPESDLPIPLPPLRLTQMRGFQPQNPPTFRWNDPPTITQEYTRNVWATFEDPSPQHLHPHPSTLIPNCTPGTVHPDDPAMDWNHPYGPWGHSIQARGSWSRGGTNSSSSLPIIELSNNSDGELDTTTTATPFPPDSPFNTDRADYNWLELSKVSRDLFSPYRTADMPSICSYPDFAIL
ncbi:hypothetical protein DFS33DRAFT_1376568 [Desarmillaria ectypa]|nr:hypothetical protein DFS33DRAFT_1376568 [Desarmillaria ectypa]